MEEVSQEEEGSRQKEISYGLRVRGGQVLKAEISRGREEAIKRGRKGKR